MYWVCCGHEAQTDFEVNNHYFSISWAERMKAQRIPVAFPEKPFFIPIIIFVTSLNLLQFHHICTLQA